METVVEENGAHLAQVSPGEGAAPAGGGGGGGSTPSSHLAAGHLQQGVFPT